MARVKSKSVSTNNTGMVAGVPGRAGEQIVFDRSSFMSNYFPCEIWYEGEGYQSAQHAFQAAKTKDPTVRATFSVHGNIDGATAKSRGKSLKIRGDWEETKLGIMAEILTIKFSNPDLRDKLLATGNATLIKGTTCGETFWGMSGNRGTNHLGNILMKVRDYYAKM